MLLTTYQFRNMIEKPGEEIISNYPADTLYFHGTRMTPMGRILTDLLSIPCWPTIAWEAPFIRVYQFNPCHPRAIFKGRVVTVQSDRW